jgi:two-component system capsular synthesis response regulator RcsB
MTRIAIADDHPLVLIGLQRALEGALGVEIAGEANNSTELVALLDQGGVDLLITDFHMPGGRFGDGGTLVGFLQRRYPQLRIIVITMLTNPLVLQQILSSGVQGLLLKNAGHDETVHAVANVAAGHTYVGRSVRELVAGVSVAAAEQGAEAAQLLSPRELEVLRLFVSGLTVSEIATLQHRSVKTVSHQKVAALRKLGIENDRDLYEYGLRNGLI